MFLYTGACFPKLLHFLIETREGGVAARTSLIDFLNLSLQFSNWVGVLTPNPNGVNMKSDDVLNF